MSSPLSDPTNVQLRLAGVAEKVREHIERILPFAADANDAALLRGLLTDQQKLEEPWTMTPEQKTAMQAAAARSMNNGAG